MDKKLDLAEKTLSREDLYVGKILTLHIDQALLPNGKSATREVVDHCPCAAILALDERNNVLTVTQYRYPLKKDLLEIPAGKLEKDEDPVSGALRELQEETGAVPDEFLPLGRIYTSAGYCNELIYLFLARGLHAGDTHPDEDEFLIQERIPFDEMVHRIMSGEIEDAKTIAAVLKTKVLLNL